MPLRSREGISVALGDIEGYLWALRAREQKERQEEANAVASIITVMTSAAGYARAATSSSGSPVRRSCTAAGCKRIGLKQQHGVELTALHRPPSPKIQWDGGPERYPKAVGLNRACNAPPRSVAPSSRAAGRTC